MDQDKKIEIIVNFIEKIYKPVSVKVRHETQHWENETHKETVIIVNVDEIDDSYLTNQQYINLDVLKEKNLAKEIRKLLYNYFGIETSGLSVDGFAPYKFKGITIVVRLIK